MSPIDCNSLETRMIVLSSACYNIKKLSVMAQINRSLYNSANFKNVSLTILIAAWNIKVFLIPWYTHPVLKKYIVTQETNQAVFVKRVSQRQDFTARLTND